MKPLCEIPVIVPSHVTMHIQECQLALEHILCMMVEQFYSKDFGKRPHDRTPQIFLPTLGFQSGLQLLQRRAFRLGVDKEHDEELDHHHRGKEHKRSTS
jgi:hypothetical protein